MKLEQSDSSLLFSNTEIPDLFFTEYLSQASGDFVKVYLYISFLSKYNKEIKINDLSKKLELPLKTLQDAIKYWEDLGILIRKGQGYLLANIQEIELNKLYKPKVTSSASDIKKSQENQYRAKAIETINNEFFQGVMSPSWYTDIDLWFKKYGFDEEVMISLFGYCFNKSALHHNYIQVVAEAWAKNKIKTFSDLNQYYEREEKVHKFETEIKKKLRLGRNLSVYESAYVEKWCMDFAYGMDVIEIALKQTTSKTNPNFKYIDSMISNWHERNLKSPEQVTAFLNSIKQKNKTVKELEKKSTYNNYTQRDYSNLNDLYTNVPPDNKN